ncbi:hypothetical protein BJ170DRAFT_213703 [Xylariales sp. AK1849]|nr:hypothetical protein BJ170DRAFT_213703 [Xylariales sp. AK1849]
MAALPTSPQPASVVPAQLGFLAIFNPTLGATDETIDDQIVYYASVDTQHDALPRRRHRGSKAKPTDGIDQEERNERLRQIGLAQGMVEFSRGFAGGRPVDTIETEKSRVVLHELEPGWWILASIDLTKLPLPPRLGNSASRTKDKISENVEYSSREVKPTALLLQDLLRAHSVFLLHHAASLSALFVRSKRSKSVAVLGRYWDLFLSTWNVMLHGNPACSVFGGIKVAACGELGFGVGEEERGSGEREVLEGFIDRVEGLVDLVVSKFGDFEPDKTSEDKTSDDGQVPKWLGTGDEPGAEDGAVFLGVGTLSRSSLRDLTHWMEDLYMWGEDAYGVKDSPTSTRAKPKRMRVKSVSNRSDSTPQPSAVQAAANQTSGEADQAKEQNSSTKQSAEPDGGASTDEGGMNKFVNYLKMGYGTHWSLGSSGAGRSGDQTPESDAAATPAQDRPALAPRRYSRPTADGNTGHFLIGLQGDVEDAGSDSGSTDSDELESRTLVRTLTVELEGEAHKRPREERTRDFGSGDNELRVTRSGRTGHKPTFDSQDRNKTNRVRVVVYVSRPFIYTFLFTNRTDSLAWDSLYRSLHYQLEPLRKPLSLSTSYRPDKPKVGAVASHIFDLIWDPRSGTVQSTIPSIPDSASMMRLNSNKALGRWSRVEALNTHMQILNTYAATRQDNTDLERTCKTSRGWWVVWTRILDTNDSSPPDGSRPQIATHDSTDSSESTESADSTTSIALLAPPSTKAISDSNKTATPADPDPASRQREKKRKANKEIFLIRRAGEGGVRGEGWADGASRLAQGIGIDTKKYIEGLLSLGQ